MLQAIQKIGDKEVINIFPKEPLNWNWNKMKYETIRFKLFDLLWHLSILHCVISNKICI